MNTKLTGSMLILMFLAIGGIGGFLYGSQQSVTPTVEHQAIVDSFTLSYGAAILESECLKTSSAEWTLTVLEDNFYQGMTYSYTFWIFSYNGDPEVCACVWGPGIDGKSYQVELSAIWSERSYTARWYGESKTFNDYLIVPVQLS